MMLIFKILIIIFKYLRKQIIMKLHVRINTKNQRLKNLIFQKVNF